MKLQQKASIIATCTAFFLTIIKLFIGLFSGSIAILSSAIDSFLDMFMSIFNMYALRTSEKTPDDTFNYGKWKIEALVAFFEGIIIMLSGVFILTQSIRKIFSPEPIREIGLWVMVMVFSVIVTLVLVLFLRFVYKKTGNIVVHTDSLHYQTDLLSNTAILASLLIIYFTGFEIIDVILGIIIAFYVIYSAYGILKNWYQLLLDISLDSQEVEKIQQIILNAPKISTYHEFRTRQSGAFKFVEAHLVFSPEILLIDAHDISHQIEDSIQKLDNQVSWKIVFHLEPYDDSVNDKK